MIGPAPAPTQPPNRGGGGGADGLLVGLDGGSGGGMVGQDARSNSAVTGSMGGQGGSQTRGGSGGYVSSLYPNGTNGAFFIGGAGASSDGGGGGGGGYYGGGGGVYTGGGGGSSYSVGNITVNLSGNRRGHGFVIIVVNVSESSCSPSAVPSRTPWPSSTTPGPSELEVTHTNNPMVRNNFELVPLGRQAQQGVDNHEGGGDDDDALDNLHDIDLDTEARFGMI
eukprot:gene111-110_t